MTVFTEEGDTMSPPFDFIVWDWPSRCWIMRSHPQSASRSVIFKVILKSACFLLNSLCSFSLIITITSPASVSGYSSDLPWNVYLWLLFTPLFKLTSKTSFTLSIFWALHLTHFLPLGMMQPSPSHLSQWAVVCVYIPGPNWTIRVTCPPPLHWPQVVTPSPPFPLQSLHSL